MPQFAANLSMLFTEVPFAQRFERAARGGFSLVECQFPYELAASEIRQLLDSHGLTMVLHNLPAGDWVAGDRGIACDPARVNEFQAGVVQAISYATTLGVKKINCLAGKLPEGVSEPLARQTLIDNLRYAATALAPHGIQLLIEPINRFDIPGFLLDSTAKALSVIDELGEPGEQHEPGKLNKHPVLLQYDVYHAQRMEGELAANLQKYLHCIGHIQIADNPGRHEPGTGEINFPFLFDWIDQLGYAGVIGAEYKPSSTTEESLGWMQATILG
ncbi:MAG: hydroxypyruvate isomerase [Oxalobacteraceae bacterium]|nr:hydroxypyruvate isomerase [Oxalobacteraceae bacterium]